MNTCHFNLKNPFACVALALVLNTSVQAESTVSVQFYAGFTFTGTLGSPRTIEYVDALASGSQSWNTFTNFNLPSSPFFLVDTTSPDASKRFYRAQPEGVTLRMYPGLTIMGNVGSTNLVQYASAPGTWTTLETVVLPGSPYLWIDTMSPPGAKRTYRAFDIGLPPSITSASSAMAQANYPFSYQITAESYPPITSYGASGLPAGLAVNPANGLISGTPAAVGISIVTITATSANGTGDRTLTLDVRATFAPELVIISPGTFTLGSPTGEIGHEADESPQTVVTISSAFAIGKYEVTQAEYGNITGTNPSFFTGNSNRPVEMVCWSDATNYCALLTARDRQAGVIPATYEYRLPTEAEWEFATRAGTTTRFSFGDLEASLDSYGWYTNNSAATPQVVGQKLPNSAGLYDVHGNVWEWCCDYYGSYPGGSVTDPKGPSSGTKRVLRGGSWYSSATDCRSANRYCNSPTMRNGDVGFRVVLAPVSASPRR